MAMTITLPHMSIALLVALGLHGGVAFWLTLPAPERQEPPEKMLRVSLLAVVAETPTVAAPITPPSSPPPQPKMKPPVTPKAAPKPQPKPKPVPKPAPKPVIQKPIPQPEPLPVEDLPEIVEAPPPVEDPSPLPLPLSVAATAKYEQLLVAWLDKYKKYPRRAQRMRIEGEVLLRILINRAGQTRDITLEQSSGNRLLDKAALAMAKQANPFPPMPDNDPRQGLEFTVPVVFALR